MTKTLLTVFLVCVGAMASHAQIIYEGENGDTEAPQVSGPKRALTATVPNDVNGDGVVNAVDVVDVIKHIKGNSRSAYIGLYGDVNGDGVINQADAEQISQVVSGTIISAGDDPGTGDNPSTNPDPTTPFSTVTGGSLADPIAPN